MVLLNAIYSGLTSSGSILGEEVHLLARGFEASQLGFPHVGILSAAPFIQQHPLLVRTSFLQSLGRFDIARYTGSNRPMISCAPQQIGGGGGTPSVPPGGSGGGGGDDGDDWLGRWEGNFRRAAAGTTNEVQGRSLKQMRLKIGNLHPKLRDASLSGMLHIFRKLAGREDRWVCSWDWFDWSVDYYADASASLDVFLSFLDLEMLRRAALREQVVDGLSKVRPHSQVEDYRLRSHRRDVGRLLWGLLDEDNLDGADAIGWFKHMNKVDDADWTAIVEAYTPSGLDQAPPGAMEHAAYIRDRNLRRKALEIIGKSRIYHAPSKAVSAVREYGMRAQVDILSSMSNDGYDVGPYVGRILKRLVRYYDKETTEVSEKERLPAEVRDDLLFHIAMKIVDDRLSPTLWGPMVYGRTRYLVEANKILNELTADIRDDEVHGIRASVQVSMFDEAVKYKRLRGRVYSLYRAHGGV